LFGPEAGILGGAKMYRTFVAAAVIACTSLGGTTLAAVPDAGQIRTWLAQLDDDDFARREEATARLQAAGEASIDALAKGAVSTSPETAWRAGEALKQIALEGNERTLDRVAAALDRVALHGRGGMNQVVAEIRVRQRQLRHDRAATKIRQLGGTLSDCDSGFGGETVWIGGGMLMPVAMPMIIEEEELAVEIVRMVDLAPAAAEVPAEVADEVARADDGPDEKGKVDVPKRLPKAEALDLRDIVKELFPAKQTPARAEARIVIEPRPAAPAPAEEKPAEDKPADEAVEDKLAEADPAPVADLGATDLGIALTDIDVEFAGEMAVGGVAEVSAGRPESLTLGSQWRGGDQGLQVLRDLPEITSLNIQGAELSDAALTPIASLPQLARLHIQGTKFSVAALRKLHRDRPNTYLFC
jgi:hypothetical protein